MGHDPCCVFPDFSLGWHRTTSVSPRPRSRTRQRVAVGEFDNNNNVNTAHFRPSVQSNYAEKVEEGIAFPGRRPWQYIRASDQMASGASHVQESGNEE